MATTTMNDLFSAIDAYMQTNANGGKNYLATHIAAIFSDTGAPLNAKTGILRDVANSLGDFRSALMAMYKGGKGGKAPLTDFGTILTSSNTSFKTFSKKLLTLNSKITTFNNYIDGLPKIVSPSSVPRTIPSSTSGVSDLTKKVMGLMYDYLRPTTFLYRNGIGVRVQNFDTAALNQISNLINKEPVLNPSTSATPPTIIDRIRSIFSSRERTSDTFSDNSKSSKKGMGMWGTLTTLGIVTFIIGWLKRGLDKSSTGRMLQTKIKDTISDMFSWIKNFITSDETIAIMKTGVSAIIDSLWWLTKQFFTKIVGPAMGKLIDEVPTVAKGVILGIILKLNKWTLGIFDFVSHFKVLDAFLKTPPPLPGAAKSPGKIMKLLTGVLRKIGPKLLKVLRFVPGLGLILSFGFAAKRMYDGDYVGGIIEILSGIAYQFGWTGIGLAIGLGLDAFNMFLDSKQDEPANKGKGKGSIILGLFSSAGSWIAEKLGASMRNMPVIGGLIRFGDAVMKMKDDPLGGMADLLKSLYYMTPIPQLEYVLGFIDYLTGSSLVETSSELIAKVGDWFNPTAIIDKVTSWAKNLWQSAISIFDFFPVASPQPRKTDGRGNPLKNTNVTASKSSTVRQVVESTPVASPQPRKTDKSGNQLKNINVTAKRVTPTPTISSNTKEEIVLAKNTASFDLAMSKISDMINDRLDILIEAAAANVQATIQGSNNVAHAVVASTGSKASSSPSAFEAHDPIRTMRTKVNNSIR